MTIISGGAFINRLQHILVLTVSTTSFKVSAGTSLHPISLTGTPIMEEGDTWMNLFFSGSRPDILKTSELEGQKFRPFCVEDDNWELGAKADKSRPSDANTIQVFWLRIRGHRKYIAKVVGGDNHYMRAPINYLLVSLLF